MAERIDRLILLFINILHSPETGDIKLDIDFTAGFITPFQISHLLGHIARCGIIRTFFNKSLLIPVDARSKTERTVVGKLKNGATVNVSLVFTRSNYYAVVIHITSCGITVSLQYRVQSRQIGSNADCLRTLCFGGIHINLIHTISEFGSNIGLTRLKHTYLPHINLFIRPRGSLIMKELTIKLVSRPKTGISIFIVVVMKQITVVH